MPEDLVVDVREVVVPRKRMRIANHIEELAASIDKNGLLHPITLRRDKKKLILVAGRRRLEAVKLLKYGTVKARILDIDETQALLIEIDENLQRAELTALQHAQHIAERKKVWEALHPQTKHGGAPGNKGKGKGKASPIKVADSATLIPPEPNGKPPEAFVKATAKAVGTAERNVYKSAQIGENLCRAAQELLAGTPVEDRKTDLLKISRLDKQEQVEVAQRIHDGEATNYYRARKLEDARRINAEPNPLPGGPFRVIVADPPWTYNKRPNDSDKRETTDYADMSLEQIKELAVPSIAHEDSILWLWTTNAHLPEAFSVARAWGFAYKTLLTWDKCRPGMGDWLRGQTEHCLLCACGKATVLLRSQTTIIAEQRQEHSEKPEAFYALVESLCPGSKVELFSRKPRNGWQSWGS